MVRSKCGLFFLENLQSPSYKLSMLLSGQVRLELEKRYWQGLVPRKLMQPSSS